MRLGAIPGAGDDTVRAVAVADLGKTFAHRHRLPVRTGGQVRVPQRIAQVALLVTELTAQDRYQAALLGLENGAGVVRDQAREPIAKSSGTQPAGTVERMEPGPGQVGRVPDVVQPRGRDEDLPIVRTECGDPG